MDNKTSIDRSILIPIGIGTFSVLGICIALLIVYLDKPRAPDPIDQPATPFKYLFLATETLIPSPQMETDIPEEIFVVETNIPTLEVTQLEKSFSTAVTPAENTPATPVLAPTRSSTNTAVINDLPSATNAISTSNAVTPTSTVDETELFLVGKYDDTDSRIEYVGDWTNDLFVEGAYLGTRYVSTSADNTAAFTFAGRQLIIGYIGSSDLGTATVSIDSTPYQLNQANGNSWSSPQLALGQHSVVITHKTGDLIFLDYIDIRGSS